MTYGADEKEDINRKAKDSWEVRHALKKYSYGWKNDSLQMTWGAPDLFSLTGCHEKFASVLQVKGCLASSANPMENWDVASLLPIAGVVCPSVSAYWTIMLMMCQNWISLPDPYTLNSLSSCNIRVFVRNVTMTDTYHIPLSPSELFMSLYLYLTGKLHALCATHTIPACKKVLEDRRQLEGITWVFKLLQL